MAHSRPAANAAPLPLLSGPRTRTETISAAGREGVDDPRTGRPVAHDVDRLGILDDDRVLAAEFDPHAPDEPPADGRMVALHPRVDDRDRHA